MRFAVHGYISDKADRPATVVWDDGVLSGVLFALDLLRLEADVRDGVWTGLRGAETERDHLSSPHTTFWLLTNVVYQPLNSWPTGDVPRAPAVSDGID